MRPEACRDCKFWEKLASDLGKCRRYPPTVHAHVEKAYAHHMALDLADVVQIGSTFPETPGDAWCGEYLDRPGPRTDPPPRAPPPSKLGWGWG